VANEKCASKKAWPETEGVSAWSPRAMTSSGPVSRSGSARRKLRAAISVNRSLSSSTSRSERASSNGSAPRAGGKSVVERLARDLQAEFPGIGGSPHETSWAWRAFYLAYTEEVSKLPRPVAQMDGENLPRPWQ